MVSMAIGEATRSSAAHAPVGPFDLDHLGRQALGDWNLQLEILRLFEQMSRIYFRWLDESTTADDFRTHLHTIKGAAAGVGAWDIRNLAAAGEAELRDTGNVRRGTVEAIGAAIAEAGAYVEHITAEQEI